MPRSHEPPTASEQNEITREGPDGTAIVLKVAELHQAMKQEPIRDRLWYRELPGGWHFAVNGCKYPRDCTPAECMTVNLRPGSFAFWFNGWLAGVLDILGDGCLAGGTAANYETLLAALGQAIEEESERERSEP